MKGQLTYWLAPNREASVPVATASLTFSSTPKFDAEAINQVWDSIVPNLPSAYANPGGRLAAQGLYTLNKLNYSLEPLRGLPKKDRASWSSTTRYVLTGGRKANCNVDSTVLAVAVAAMQRKGYVLNPVHGFLNGDNAGKVVLSTREQHQWNADTSGNQFDATPHRGLDAATKAYLDDSNMEDPAQRGKEETRQEDGGIPVAPLILGGIAAAAGISIAAERFAKRSWRRKKAVAATSTVQQEKPTFWQRQADKKLNQLDVRDLKLAQVTLNHVLYAPGSERFNGARAKLRTRGNKQSGPELIGQMRLRQDMSSGAVIQKLQELRKQATNPLHIQAYETAFTVAELLSYTPRPRSSQIE